MISQVCYQLHYFPLVKTKRFELLLPGSQPGVLTITLSFPWRVGIDLHDLLKFWRLKFYFINYPRKLLQPIIRLLVGLMLVILQHYKHYISLYKQFVIMPVVFKGNFFLDLFLYLFPAFNAWSFNCVKQ